jgi:hypothetical protein
MAWIACPESSSIAGFDYDRSARTLDIEFKDSQTTYRYFDVPADVFDDMQAAPSKGRFFSESIRGLYRYERR